MEREGRESGERESGEWRVERAAAGEVLVLDDMIRVYTVYHNKPKPPPPGPRPPGP